MYISYVYLMFISLNELYIFIFEIHLCVKIGWYLKILCTCSSRKSDVLEPTTSKFMIYKSNTNLNYINLLCLLYRTLLLFLLVMVVILIINMIITATGIMICYKILHGIFHRLKLPMLTFKVHLENYSSPVSTGKCIFRTRKTW